MQMHFRLQLNKIPLRPLNGQPFTIKTCAMTLKAFADEGNNGGQNIEDLCYIRFGSDAC
jgi:hypothetical protein